VEVEAELEVEVEVEVEVEAHVAALRAELEATIAGRLAPRRDDAAITVLGAGQDDLAPGRAYLEVLADGGWAVPTWPPEYGGRGATTVDVATIARELARYEQPDLYPYLVGLHVAGPTILALASAEQRARWLVQIRSGAEIWCQLFSEPGAGSDLANVSTSAIRDGDEWRVTGQKVWSSRAHYARWGFLLARTDADVVKHAGITAFAIDMGAPRVDVRPLLQMNGDAHFSEVFLDDVVVRDADRLGGIGEGWSVARTALANERGAITATNTGMTTPMQRLLELADERQPDRVRGDAVRAAYVDSEVSRLTVRRARDAALAGRTPGPESSGTKLRGSATFKTTANVALGLLGPGGVAAERVDDGSPSDRSTAEWQTLFLTAPSISIRGGTDEIQRNIIGERVLGLPPEPRVDVDRPFRDLPH
jgi:alkylation response protein AidB-like acyl-CoA dehydrogenase